MRASRWWRIAAIGIAAIMLFLGIAIVLLLTIDLGRFKHSLTDAASTALERELRVDGALSIRVGRTIQVSASDVVIRNADWAGDAPLVSIGSLAAEIDAASIVFGPLHVRNIELGDVSIALVESDTGEVNWQLGAFWDEAEDEPGELQGFPVIFENLAITDVTASLMSPALTDTLDVRVASLEHTIRDGRLVDHVDGTVNDTPLVVEGSIGPRSSIIGGGPATFDYQGQLGEITFDARGSFDDIHAPVEPAVEFSLHGPDAEYLFRILNLPDATRGELDLRGQLLRAAGQIKFGARGQVGEFTFEINGWASDLATLAEGEVLVAAKGPDLDRVAGVFGVDELPQSPFELDGVLRKSGTGLDVESLVLDVSGSEIELQGRLPRFPEMADAELRLTASGEDIALFADLPSLPFDVSTTAAFREDRVRLSDANVTIGMARVDLSGDIEPAGRNTRINLAIDSSVPDLDAFLSGFGIGGAPPLATEIAARVEHGGGETRISEIKGRIGEVEMVGSLVLGTEAEQYTAAFDAGLRGPHLDAILPETQTFTVADKPFDMQFHGSYSGERLELTGATVTLGEANLSVQGSIDDVGEMSGVDLLVKADVPDLAALGSSEQFAIPALPLRLAGGVTGARDTWSANDFLTILGNSRFQASVRYARGDVPDIEVDARAERIDLRDLLPKPVSRTADAGQTGERVIPEVELPVGLLNRMNLQINLAVDQLLTHRLDFRDVVLDGRVRDGALLVDTIDFRGRRGHLVGEIDYRPDGDRWLLNGKFAGDNLIFASPEEADATVFARPKFELESSLAGQGTTVRGLLGSLEGHTLLHGGKGAVPGKGGLLTGMFFGDFATQLLDTLNPFTKEDENTRIRCAVLLLDYDDGIVSGDPALVMQTAKLTLFATGTVNLDSEAVKISINTVARKGLGLGFSDIVSPYTIVRGTLASPTLTLSEKDVLFQGGAAVATGGLTILARSLKNRFLSDKDPCNTALETYRKAAEEPE